MKELKRPNSVFYAGYVRSSLLKTPKTCKTRQTKTRITQNFPIVWLIQGSTMSKSMPRAFQKCGTFWYSKVLNQSYWLSKSRQISKKKNQGMGSLQKTVTFEWGICALQNAYQLMSIGLTWADKRFEAYRCLVQKLQFFATKHNFGDESKISDSVDFEQP